MREFFASFLMAFGVVFVAELGDKTQFAVLALAGSRNPWGVWVGGSVALLLATGLAVVLGSALSRWLDPRWLHYGAASLFVLIGLFLFIRGPQLG